MIDDLCKLNLVLNSFSLSSIYVDFLDITLDLRTAIYKPYKKPKSDLTYIHKQSNHPPTIIKNLPKASTIGYLPVLKMLRDSMKHAPHTQKP